MPRSSRLIDDSQPTVYHVMSRTALNGRPFDDVANDELLGIIKEFSRLYFAEILGFCLMGNHFHMLVRMHTESEFSDAQIKQRYTAFFGKDAPSSDDAIDHYRTRYFTDSGIIGSKSFVAEKYQLFKHLVARNSVLPGLRPSVKVPDSHDQKLVLTDLIDNTLRKAPSQAPACPF